MSLVIGEEGIALFGQFVQFSEFESSGAVTSHPLKYSTNYGLEAAGNSAPTPGLVQVSGIW